MPPPGKTHFLNQKQLKISKSYSLFVFSKTHSSWKYFSHENTIHLLDKTASCERIGQHDAMPWASARGYPEGTVFYTAGVSKSPPNFGMT